MKKNIKLISLILFASLSLSIAFGYSVYERKEVQYLNERSKEVKCKIIDKYYRTPEHSGHAHPILSFSFYLEDDETKIGNNFTERIYANQIDFDNVKIGDIVLCNIIYVPELHTSPNRKNTLQIHNIEIIYDNSILN